MQSFNQGISVNECFPIYLAASSRFIHRWRRSKILGKGHKLEKQLLITFFILKKSYDSCELYSYDAHIFIKGACSPYSGGRSKYLRAGGRCYSCLLTPTEYGSYADGMFR